MTAADHAAVSAQMDAFLVGPCMHTVEQYADLWSKSIQLCVSKATSQCRAELNADQLEALVAFVDSLLEFTWEKLNTGHWKDVHVGWRRLYTVLAASKARAIFGRVAGALDDYDDLVQRSLVACDMGLIMGAPLRNADDQLAQIAARLNATFPDTDETMPDKIIVNDSLRRYAERAEFEKDVVESVEVPRVRVPSMECFMIDFVQQMKPLVITGATEHWPARKKWRFLPFAIRSVPYIYSLVKRRSVPVEIGSRYTDADWSQKIMTIKEFVLKFVRNFNEKEQSETEPIGYIAQHQLFDQLHELAHDFNTPDHCWCASENEGEVDVNAWFGPGGTVSPLHQDPRDNLLAQVFGTKRVRLIDVKHTDLVYPHTSGSILTNTSQVDIECPDLKSFPYFAGVKIYDLILMPGDMLYIPKKWWHHVRSLDESFSISFWFGNA